MAHDLFLPLVVRIGEMLFIKRSVSLTLTKCNEYDNQSSPV